MAKPNKWQRILAYFAVSYLLLFVLQFLLSSIGWMGSWGNTPTFYLMPFAGFFIAFLGLGEVEKLFNFDTLKKPWIVLGFIVLFLLAWHVALTFYFQNSFFLQLRSNSTYNEGGPISISEECYLPALSETGKTTRNIWVDSLGLGWCTAGKEYSGQLTQSSYLVFCLAALLGVAFNAIERKKFGS